MARDLLRPTTADMAMADTEATAMARGPPMLRPLPLPSQRLMLTMAMVATEATDMERGPQMPTMAATDMAAMAMARGLLTLMLTMVAMDMAAMVATDTARGLPMPMLTTAAMDMAAMV